MAPACTQTTPVEVHESSAQVVIDVAPAVDTAAAETAETICVETQDMRTGPDRDFSTKDAGSQVVPPLKDAESQVVPPLSQTTSSDDLLSCLSCSSALAVCLRVLCCSMVGVTSTHSCWQAAEPPDYLFYFREMLKRSKDKTLKLTVPANDPKAKSWTLKLNVSGRVCLQLPGTSQSAAVIVRDHHTHHSAPAVLLIASSTCRGSSSDGAAYL